MAQDTNEIGLLKSVELFETTMDEQYNHHDGKNNILIVARDENDTLCGCFGNVDHLALSLAGSCVKDERLTHLLISAFHYLVKRNPLLLLEFFSKACDGDDTD